MWFETICALVARALCGLALIVTGLYERSKVRTSANWLPVRGIIIRSDVVADNRATPPPAKSLCFASTR